jgi:hypothetical protein
MREGSEGNEAANSLFWSNSSFPGGLGGEGFWGYRRSSAFICG